MATVFHSRVEEVAVATSSTVAGVLGAALAHEMGHLLLGRGAHSRGGIMRCPWDTEELRSMHRGQLVFDAAQALSIGKSIAARRPGLRAAAR